MQWRGPYTVESHVGANKYRVKMGSKTKTYHINMLKKYISREPDVEGNVVPVDSEDGATIAVAGVIQHQKEGVCVAKLGEELVRLNRVKSEVMLLPRAVIT